MQPMKHSAQRARHASTAGPIHPSADIRIDHSEGRRTMAIRVGAVARSIEDHSDELEYGDDQRPKGDGPKRERRGADE